MNDTTGSSRRAATDHSALKRYTCTSSNRHVYLMDPYACVSTKSPDFQIPWTNYEQTPLPDGPVAQSIQNLSQFGKTYAWSGDRIDMSITTECVHTIFQMGKSFGCFVPQDHRGGGSVRKLSTKSGNLDILGTCMHVYSHYTVGYMSIGLCAALSQL